jgi:hypothetical protein
MRRRISKFDLEKLIKENMGVSEIARTLHASKSTISERCKNLGLKPVNKRGIGTGLVLSQGDNRKLDPVGQLRKINKLTLEILEEAMAALRKDSKAGKKIINPLGLIFKSMSQIESQIKTEFSILEGLHEMEAQQSFKEFSEEVLSVIEEVDPDVKREIIKRLHERKTARATFGRA